MNKIQGKTFKDETVELDGFIFANCTFENVHIIFRGTAPFGFDHPVMRGNTTMEFADSARLTLQSLDALYKTGGSFRQWVEHVVESFSAKGGNVEH
jgi:hypothetical protein